MVRDARTDWGVVETVKISWQQSALGRSAVSRGTIRWPFTYKVFTLDEIAATIKDQEVLDETDFARATGPLKIAAEEIPKQVDTLIEQPLGNFLLTAVLLDSVKQRWQQCWE